MAFSRFQTKNEDYLYNDQKLNYITTRNKDDYSFACKMLSKATDDKMRKEILNVFMPNKTDILDYGDRDFKIFIDTCQQLKIDMPFEINNYENKRIDSLKINSAEDEVVKHLLNRVKKEDITDANQFIISDWLSIEPFIKQLKKMRKGEQHKMCKDALNILRDKWNQTYIHNTEDNYRTLQKIFKFHNITNTMIKDNKSKYMKAQFFDCITRIPETLNKLHESVDVLNDCTDNITTFNNICGNILDKVESTIRHTAIVLLVVKLLAFAYLLKNKLNRTIDNIGALIILILPSDVTSNLINVSDLTRAIQGIVERYRARLVPPGNLLGYQNLGIAQFNDIVDDASIFSSFFSLAKACTIGMFSDMDKDKFMSLHIKSNKVKMVADFLRGASTITDYFFRLIEKLMEMLGDVVLKYYGVVPEFYKQDELEILINEYVKYNTTGVFEDCFQENLQAEKVMDLYDKSLKLEAKMNLKMIKYTTLHRCAVMPYLRIMVKHLETIVNRIPPHLKGKGGCRRLKPYWLYIFGEPRVGKSSVLQPVIINALVLALGFRDKYEDPHNYSYFRTLGDKYWEKYKKPVVVQINDALQTYTDEELINQAILELTNIIDDQPFPLNMAFEDKGAVYFTSPIVVSNAQKDIVGQTFITNKCWSGGEHVFARRNIVVELKLNPKYQDVSGTGVNWDYAMRELAEGKKPACKYTDVYPNDLWNLVFYDRLKGSIIFNDTFDRGCDRIVEDAKQYFKVCTSVKNDIFKSMERVWKAQMNDIKDPPASRMTTEGGKFKLCPDCNKHVEEKHYKMHTLRHCENISFPIKDTSCQTENFYDASDCNCIQAVTNYVLNKYNQDINIQHPLINRVLVEQIAYRHFCQINLKNGNSSHACISSQKECDIIYEEFLGRIVIILRISKFDAFVEKFRDAKKIFRDFMSGFMIGCGAYMLLAGIVTLVSFIVSWMRSKRDEEIVTDYEPQSHEGNRKARKIKIQRKVRERNLVTKGGRAQLYDQANLDIESIIKHHFVNIRLLVERGDDDVDIQVDMNAFCVGGSIFAIPRHYWHRIQLYHKIYSSYNEKLKLKFSWNSKMNQIIELSCIDVFYPDNIHTADLCFIRVRRLMAMRDIRHFFVSDDDDPSLFGSYLFGFRSSVYGANAVFDTTMITVSDVGMQSVFYDTDETEDRIHGIKIEPRRYRIPLCYTYADCKSVRGDCGMVLMCTDSSSNRRILGIHTAGVPSIETGCAAPIYQEDLNEAFEYFNDLGIPVIVMESEPAMVTTQMNDISKLHVAVADLGAKVIGAAGCVEVNGKQKQLRATIPRRSKISESKVYDWMEEDFGKCKFAPARLAPFQDENGETISPFLKAFKKLMKCSNMISEKEYSIISEHMAMSTISWTSPYTKGIKPKVLSDFETVNGCLGLNPIDPNTSAGCPYTSINNTQGKNPWLKPTVSENGKITYEMIGLCRDRFDKRIELAKQGIIYSNIVIDTLKDETRPLAKVKEGKTRMFEMHCMDLNLAIRKYYGHFIAHCTLSHDSEISVGINCNSVEWDRMVNMLRTVNELLDAFMNGDFSDYDASLLLQWILTLADSANAFYNGTDEENLIRLVLLVSTVCRYDLIENFLILVEQGNTSGNALTALINCYVNMMLSRLTFLRTNIADTLEGYLKYIKAKYYGDDNLKNIHKSIKDRYNMFTFSEIVKKIGMTYTSADKLSEMKELYTIDECSYLKRSFYKDNNLGIWKNQLDYDVIITIPMFSESDPDNMRDQMNRFNSSLLELSNYGRKKMQYVKQYFVKYCLKLKEKGYNISPVDLFTYDYIFETMYPTYSQKYWLDKHYADRSDFDDGSNDELLYNGPDCNVGKLSIYTPEICINSVSEKFSAQMNDSIIEITDDEMEIVMKRCTRGLGRCVRVARPLYRTCKKQLVSVLSDFGFTQRNVGKLTKIITNTLATIDEEEIPILQAQMNDCIEDIDYDEWALRYLRGLSPSKVSDIKKNISNMITSMNVVGKHEEIIKYWHLTELPFDLRKILAIKRNIQLVFQEKINDSNTNGEVARILSSMSGHQKFEMFRYLTLEYARGTINIAPDGSISKAEKSDEHDYEQLVTFYDEAGKPQEKWIKIPREQDIQEAIQKLKDENAQIVYPEGVDHNAYLRNIVNDVLQYKNMGSAQMNDSQSTTNFQDGDRVDSEIIETRKPPMPHAVGSETIEGFLNRPVLVSRVSWSPTNALGSNLVALSFPQVMLTNYNTGETVKKLSGFHLMAPDIEIEFRLTSTDMHYGRLMVNIIPLHDVICNTYDQFENASSFEWYQVDASGNQTMSFVVPYRHFIDAIELTAKATDTIKNLFDLNLYISAPLGMLSGTASNVIISIYAKFVKPNLHGFSLEPMIAQMNDAGTEAIAKTKEDVIVSKVVEDFGNFALNMQDIPMVGDYAKPIGKAALRNAKLLRKYGFSIPPSVAAPTPTTRINTRYNYVEDLPATIPLVNSATAATSKDFSLVHGFPGEMDFVHFAQRPFLTYVGQVAASMTSGTTLYTFDLNPLNQVHINYVNSTFAPMTAIYGGPMNFVSRYFHIWRGSIRFMISFVASSYHTATFRVFWDPTAGNTKSYGEGYTHGLLNETISLDKQRDLMVTIPFQQDLSYLKIGDYTTSKKKGYSNGRLIMQIVNPLSSASATVNPIYFQVFTSVGSDFDWGLPTTMGIAARGVMQAQMSDRVTETFQSSSFKKSMEANYPTIGKASGMGFKAPMRNQSYAITSFKQLCNMHSYVAGAPGTRTYNLPTAGRVDMYMNPSNYYNFGAYDATTNPYGDQFYFENYLLNVKCVFLFHRGSYRVGIRTNNTSEVSAVLNPSTNWYNGTNVIQVNYEPSIGEPGNHAVVEFPATAVNSTTNFLLDRTADATGQNQKLNYSEGLYFADEKNSDIDVTLPYYSIFQCHVNNFAPVIDYNDSMTVRFNMVSASIREILDSSTTNQRLTPNKVAFFLSGGDDFIMGCQIGIPKSKSLTSSIVSGRNKRSVGTGDEVQDWLSEQPIDWDNLDETMFNITPPHRTLAQPEILHLNRYKDPESRKKYLRMLRGEIFDVGKRAASLGWTSSRSQSPEPLNMGKAQMNDTIRDMVTTHSLPLEIRRSETKDGLAIWLIKLAIFCGLCSTTWAAAMMTLIISSNNLWIIWGTAIILLPIILYTTMTFTAFWKDFININRQIDAQRIRQLKKDIEDSFKKYMDDAKSAYENDEEYGKFLRSVNKLTFDQKKAVVEAQKRTKFTKEELDIANQHAKQIEEFRLSHPELNPGTITFAQKYLLYCQEKVQNPH